MKQLVPIIALYALLLCSCASQRQTEPKHYKTLSEKATTTLRFNQREYSINCSVQIWRNELIILSLQPILGIEMFRIEATKDSLLVLDKMNRRYTTLAYHWAEREIRPMPSFKMIQDFVTAPTLKKINVSSELSFAFGGHEIGVKCTFSHREYNTLTVPKRIDLKKYKRVSLRDILPL